MIARTFGGPAARSALFDSGMSGVISWVRHFTPKAAYRYGLTAGLAYNDDVQFRDQAFPHRFL